MKQRIKQWIKKGLTVRQCRQYDKLLEKKTVTYDAWIRNAERVWRTQEENGVGMQIRFVPYEACEDYVTGSAMRSDEAQVVVFSDDNGAVSAIAERVIEEFFATYEDINLAYGDEDVMSPEGIRYTPWLKPDWSPDTFLSYFYFGSIFAVRMSALRALTQEEKQWIWKTGMGDSELCEGDRSACEKDPHAVGIYRLCYVLATKCGGFQARGSAFPVGHIDEILFHSRVNRELELEHSTALDHRGCPVWAGGNGFEASDALPVSVIIPSKDNPKVLKQCISSIQKKQTPFAYEVIVVDNGSAESVKQELENWLSQQGEAYHYIYQPMPFHFSKMCNLGAEKARGEVLLFLNDDVEIPAQRADCNFLETLYHTAIRSYIGAAGVKLYYPQSRRIQHAGIVNLRLGPVHKLQFKEDECSYYYSWNRRRRNVIAVTGACLAVEKKKFTEAGGFPEELPVAFNDVDLCFSLHEKGYYNVVLQDITLFHHESLSRGNDDDREKLSRLLAEREKLYERHPDLNGTDPYYHKYLASHMLSTGFELRADYEEKPQPVYGKVQEEQGLLAMAREDACVIISLEYAGKTGGKSDGYLLQGYSFITGSDNACFDKYIIFRRDTLIEDAGESIRYIKAEPFLRKDVETNLPDQVHVGMTGFCVELAKDDLPQGSYRVGVLVRDKCSGQKIYAWTNRYLCVD